MKKSYRIDVDCANCANKMEQTAAKVEGVRSVVVNFMLQKMNVEFEEGADVAAVMAEVKKSCARVVSDGEIYL